MIEGADALKGVLKRRAVGEDAYACYRSGSDGLQDSFVARHVGAEIIGVDNNALHSGRTPLARITRLRNVPVTFPSSLN